MMVLSSINPQFRRNGATPFPETGVFASPSLFNKLSSVHTRQVALSEGAATFAWHVRVVSLTLNPKPYTLNP